MATAGGFFILMVLVGVGLDSYRLNNTKSDVQNAIDSAVLAVANRSDLEEDKRTSVGNDYLRVNSQNPCNNDATFKYGTSEVTGTVQCEIPTVLLGLVGINSINIEASATATIASSTSNDGIRCVIALDPSYKKTLLASGGTRLNANQCDVHVNSSNPEAVVLSGGSTLHSAENCVVGGVKQGLVNMIPQPPAHCDPINDPFASLQKPTVGACDHYDFNESRDMILNPGVYCGGMRVSNDNFFFNPGVYIIKNGNFKSTGGATLRGNGVTFFLTGTDEDAGIVWSGGGSYNFTASNVGPLAGFLVYLDPEAAKEDKSSVTGGGDVKYEGAFYFPDQTLLISGGGSVTTPSPFTAYVANIIEYTGGSSLNIDFNASATTVTIPEGFYKTSDTGDVRLIK